METRLGVTTSDWFEVEVFDDRGQYLIRRHVETIEEAAALVTDPVRTAWSVGKCPNGDPLPENIHYAATVPVGAVVRPVDDEGRTMCGSAYTKLRNGSFESERGVLLADPAGYLWTLSNN